MEGQAALWAAVLASGVYHGLNPAMGWPLAVAAGLTEGRGAAVARTLAPLAAGHLASLVVVLLPFAALTLALDWVREIRIAAGMTIVLFAAVLFCYRRHPRWIARIPPRQLAFWSFAVALVHGAGLMLVPMLLGLCGSPVLSEVSRSGGADLLGNVGLVLEVAAAHTAALVAAGGLLALTTYRVLGLQVVTRSWLDLRGVWAGSLMIAGGVGILRAL